MTTQEHFTVEEASRWLTCKQPVPLKLLQKLGKDCSMLCRLRNIQHTLRATPHQPWPNEKAYPANVIREVFAMNPDTAPFLPVTIDERVLTRIAARGESAPATFNMPRYGADMSDPLNPMNAVHFGVDLAQGSDSTAVQTAPAPECPAPNDNVNSWGTDSCSSDSGSSYTGE